MRQNTGGRELQTPTHTVGLPCLTDTVGATAAGEPLQLVSPISAVVDPSTIEKFGYARWKAELPVQKSGGNYTLTASSPQLGSNSSARIVDVTFGDVWFCSGQVSRNKETLHPSACSMDLLTSAHL